MGGGQLTLILNNFFATEPIKLNFQYLPDFYLEAFKKCFLVITAILKLWRHFQGWVRVVEKVENEDVLFMTFPVFLILLMSSKMCNNTSNKGLSHRFSKKWLNGWLYTTENF